MYSLACTSLDKSQRRHFFYIYLTTITVFTIYYDIYEQLKKIQNSKEILSHDSHTIDHHLVRKAEKR